MTTAKMRRTRGFTLLEVMMATAVLAVGTISVLMIFGTALSFAHRRQGQQQLAQVLEEARSDARALVNAWRPGKGPAAPAPGKKPSSVKDAAPVSSTPAGQTQETAVKTSTVFGAYRYKIRFDPVQAAVPEAGWRSAVTVEWGDGQSYTESLVVTSDVIPDEEFKFSTTYDEERKDAAKSKSSER